MSNVQAWHRSTRWHLAGNRRSFLHPYISVRAGSFGAPFLCRGLQFAFREVDLLAAAFAAMLFIEFVREDFDFLLAVRTPATKGTQVLEFFESGTIARFVHCLLLS